jgi:hypothetical protein
MFLEPVIHNILLSMEPKYVPLAPQAIQFPKIWTLLGKQGVRQVQKRSYLKLGIPIVPVPRVVQLCEFCWRLVWCDAKFRSGSQRSRGFQGHKSMRLVTKRTNILLFHMGRKHLHYRTVINQPLTRRRMSGKGRWLCRLWVTSIDSERTRNGYVKNKNGNVRKA